MEDPCIGCVDDAQCGEACSKYRFYAAHKAGEAFTKEVIQSAESIKARPDPEE